VVVFAPAAVVGLRASSGVERWRIVETVRPQSIYVTPGFPEVHGCRVAFHRAAGTRMLAEMGESWDAVEVDAHSGVERALGPGHVIELGPDYAVIEDATGKSVLDKAGTRSALPDRTRYVVSPGRADEIAVVVDVEGDLRGVEVKSGRALWGHPAERVAPNLPILGDEVTSAGIVSEHPLLTRVGDDAIAAANRTVQRLDLRTGRARWSVGIGDEGPRGDASQMGLSGDEFFIASRVDPALIATLDANTGALRALRLAPQDPVHATAVGRTLVLASYEELLGIDLDREAAPLRSLLTLDADVEASVRQLRTEPKEGATSGFLPWHVYPAGRRAATQWLHHLLPLVGERLLERLRTASIDDAILLLDVFRGDASPRTGQALLELLHRTIAAPTTDNARLRLAVADAFSGSTLPPDVADGLAGSMVEWVTAMRPEWLAARDGSGGCGAALSLKRSCVAMQAVVESRNLLERASGGAGPLSRFRAALGSPPVGCAPSVEDRARAAVVAHLIELYPRRELVRAPGATCVQVSTLAGRVTADTSVRPRKGDWLVVEASHVVRGADPAVTRVVGYAWEDGGHGSSGGEFVVKNVDGVWRVVDEASSWIE
jgi:hypothetical protein